MTARSRHKNITLQEPEVSIVIPVHNEEELLEISVQDLITRLRREGIQSETLLCENGSTDKTREIAEKLELQYPEIRLITLEGADYGKAMKEGLGRAKGKYLVNFDIDFYDIDFLKSALEHLEKYDIVIGSKLISKAMDHRSLLRKFITRGFSVLLKLLFRLKVYDTHGMKGFKREKISVLIEKCRLGKDLFDTELIIRAERNALRILESPITIKDKRSARIPILKRIPRTVIGLIYLRITLWKEALIKTFCTA